MNAVEKNKQLKWENSSLRNERATLKSESKKLRTMNGRLKKETDRLQSLNRTVIEQRDQAVRENEEKEKQIEALKEEICKLKAVNDHDGGTNGIPTSQTPKGKNKVIPNTRQKTGRKKGGQKGHKKHSMKSCQEEEITDTQEHPLVQCPHCGGELDREGESAFKDETDYEVKIIKKRHRFPKYRCRRCGKPVRVKIPKHLKEANQYGANIQAMILALVDLGFVSISRTRKITTGLLGGKLGISEGYVGKIQKKAFRMLKRFQEEARAFCLTQRILYWDDTVIFMNTARACFRFYGNEKVSCYRAHETKGAEGIGEDGILANLTEKTCLMHDHLKYNY